MDVLIFCILALFSGFMAFAIGRISNKYEAHLNTPYHWIYGLILMIVAVFWTKFFWSVILFSIGFGHFISDLNDFLHMRIYGSDKSHKWKFWSID